MHVKRIMLLCKVSGLFSRFFFSFLEIIIIEKERSLCSKQAILSSSLSLSLSLSIYIYIYIDTFISSLFLLFSFLYLAPLFSFLSKVKKQRIFLQALTHHHIVLAFPCKHQPFLPLEFSRFFRVFIFLIQ